MICMITASQKYRSFVFHLSYPLPSFYTKQALHLEVCFLYMQTGSVLENVLRFKELKKNWSCWHYPKQWYDQRQRTEIHLLGCFIFYKWFQIPKCSLLSLPFPGEIQCSCELLWPKLHRVVLRTLRNFSSWFKYASFSRLWLFPPSVRMCFLFTLNRAGGDRRFCAHPLRCLYRIQQAPSQTVFRKTEIWE